jgi:UDP-2,3-diacylglucosamine hydrolase
MRRVFIADAHLQKPEDDNYRYLLRFLSELQGTTKSLFILGDLFEFWIGNSKKIYPHYYPVLHILQELSASGTEIFYFEGNHDFHLDRFFMENIQAKVYPNPTVLELDGKRAYICHGDQINSRDHGYRLLRFILHSRITKRLVPLIPAALAFRIAEHLSQRSKSKHGKRNSKWNYEELLKDFADEKFRDGCDAVISAHYHHPILFKKHNGRELSLMALGDWIYQYSYGEWIDGELSLRYYK